MPSYPTQPLQSRLAMALALAMLFATPLLARAETADFQTWLTELRQEAWARGISAATLDAALCGTEPIQKVIDLDRRQPEFVDTFWNYLDKRVTDQRIETGQQLLAEHGELLEKLEHRFGVPATVLVAFWGLETNFGSHLGSFPIPGALASLAYEGRRGPFFRRELLDSLAILEAGHTSAEGMRGSWAGAMGQMQFMPSTFQRYALDEDGDGRKDLWTSIPDALASAANFLKSIGWRDGAVWGQEVQLPANFNLDLLSSGSRPGAEWSALGITLADGSPLPDADTIGTILLPQGSKGPAFLVYRNFHVVMGWNRSVNYALSVTHLADRLAGLPRLSLGRDADNRPMNRDQALELQQRLTLLGFDPGLADGIVGSQTRAAVRAYQARRGLPVDGYASLALLEYLQEDSPDFALQPVETPPLGLQTAAAGKT
jgi:membrane-bound lytic murein transglycosylase B